jgi:hypothetical protein
MVCWTSRNPELQVPVGTCRVLDREWINALRRTRTGASNDEVPSEGQVLALERDDQALLEQDHADRPPVARGALLARVVEDDVHVAVQADDCRTREASAGDPAGEGRSGQMPSKARPSVTTARSEWCSRAVASATASSGVQGLAAWFIRRFGPPKQKGFLRCQQHPIRSCMVYVAQKVLL